MDQRGMPDRIRYRYMTHNPRTFQDEEIPMYLDEERTSPRWFVYSVCGSYLDMAFLLLKIVGADVLRSEEHTSEIQSIMRISYAVLCLKKKQPQKTIKYKDRDTVSTDEQLRTQIKHNK